MIADIAMMVLAGLIGLMAIWVGHLQNRIDKLEDKNDD